MANKQIKKVKVNKDKFIRVIYEEGWSIRKLGKAVDRTEKTIRRYLNEGYRESFIFCVNTEKVSDEPCVVRG